VGGAGVRRLVASAAELVCSAQGLLDGAGGLCLVVGGGVGCRWAVVARGSVAPPNTRWCALKAVY
jgi:hypothetical protein